MAKFGEYREYMPCIATDQARGRLLRCPICGARCWTAFAGAARHWLSHPEEERRRAIKEAEDG